MIASAFTLTFLIFEKKSFWDVGLYEAKGSGLSTVYYLVIVAHDKRNIYAHYFYIKVIYFGLLLYIS